MRSPAAAIAWEFRQRHRWGLIAVVAYLLVLGVAKLIILAGQRATLDDTESFAFLVMIPMSSTFMYFLAVFSFGLAGDIAARQSIYPARMFTLPVSAAELAGWPMLFGSAAMAALWLATRLLGAWPSDVAVPWIWPAVLGASLVGWTQALTWMSYGLPGLRVAVMVLWLMVIDAVVMTALHFKAPEHVMLALLAPHIPLAYLAARLAVARARRGDVPDWRGKIARLGRIVDVLPRRRDHFSSPARAQEWFEWRRNGRSLPAMVGILLPFELALLFLFRETPALVVETLLCVLLTPPFMAAFAASTVRKANPERDDSYALTPFLAARPLTSPSLVAAKLKVTLWSTLAAWLLVLVAVPLAMTLSGTSGVVIEPARRVIDVVGAPRAAAIVLVALFALVASTWKQLVQSLYIGMSGRVWAVKAYVFLALSFLAVVFPLARGVIGSKRAMAVLWSSLPWVAAVLVCLKLAAAVWIAVRLQESRLLGVRTLVLGAIAWDVIVFALYILLAWIIPAMIVRRYFLVLLAILAVPLARVAAAPLALAWNRHRS